MESGLIVNSSIKATSTFSGHFEPWQARLNGPSAWCATGSGSQHLEINLQQIHRITAIGIQGFHDNSTATAYFVKEFHLLFLSESNSWRYYIQGTGYPKVFSFFLSCIFFLSYFFHSCSICLVVCLFLPS